jgi:peptidoglycan-associated lipoprotein
MLVCTVSKSTNPTGAGDSEALVLLQGAFQEMLAYPRNRKIPFFPTKEDEEMQQQKRSLALLAGLLGIVLLAGACHKKQVAAAPPAAPPAPTPAPTLHLTAEPSTIERGQSVTLSWTSQNATDLTLEPGVGKVPAQGSTTVTPQESTTYALTATGPGGSVTETARVTVTTPPPAAPPEAPKAEVSEEEVFGQSIKDAFFDYDKADIRPDAQQALTSDADFLKAHPNVKSTIEGHCDERGSEEYNFGLGDRRATAAKSFLVNLGINGDLINTISYGKDRPSCTDHDEACWQQNRRAHFHYGTEAK